MSEVAQRLSGPCANSISTSLLLYLFDALGEGTMKWLMLLVTLVWFAVTPCWMDREKSPEDGHG